MKNAIVYYYNLKPTNIHQKSRNFYFSFENESYVLMPFDDKTLDINNLYEISLYLFQQGIYVHQFVVNKDGFLVTIINSISYVLLKTYISQQSKITINNIYVFNNILLNEKLSKVKRPGWYQLWIKKIDYFEYQVNQLGKRYPLIRESFSYFVGLSETAIILVRDVAKVDSGIAHERITKDDTLFDLYNPLNLIVDSRIRDACEYFKSCFFNSDDKIDSDLILDEIKIYIQSNRLTVDECILFLGRMIYPSFYFDIYENVLQGKDKEKSLLSVISKINNYEQLLKKIYLYLSSIMSVPEIEWIMTLR